MNKTLLLVRGYCLAMVLCTIGLTAPAAADEGPTPTPGPGSAPTKPYDAFTLYTSSIAITQKALRDSLATSPVAADAAPTAALPARAAPVARSYPRSFYTYDALSDYANSIATAQQESNARLAALMAREETATTALGAVFDPRLRGGLLRSRTDLMDNTTLKTLRTQFANDAAAGRALIANGAAVTPTASWRLPLVGEDTQDFGPTPYYFEPALTYRGVYYDHFHTGTDIAAAWGTPVLAPARGLVVFAGRMGDGAMVVVLAHDGGLVSMYAHLENRVFPLPVKAGDTVESGDRIGNVGLSGITTGTHLHWSVWRNGELIDPLSIIGG